MKGRARRWSTGYLALHCVVVLALVLGVAPTWVSSGPPWWLAFLLPFSGAYAVERWGLRRAALLFAVTYVITATGEAWGTQVGLFGARYRYVAAAWSPLPSVALVLVVPCMWFMMMVPSFAIARQLVGSGSPLPVAALGATVMTAWDAVLDPLSVEAGLWQWQSGHPVGGAIPVENYLSWWLGSAIVLGLYASAERRWRVSSAPSLRPLLSYAVTAIAYLRLVPASQRATALLTMGAVVVVVASLLFRRAFGRRVDLDIRAEWLTPPPASLIASIRRTDFASHSVKNHFVNALHVVVAHGERYMIANLRRVRARLRSPHLVRQADWFIAQEAQHAKEHRRVTARLHDFGYRTQALDWVCRFWGQTVLPRFVGARLNLAITVAIEHWTATVAELVLGRGLLAELPAAPRRLVEWHCYEELEHRSVAYDVFVALGGTYVERVLGMAIGVALVAGLTVFGMVSFLAQDGLLFSPRAWREGLAFFVTDAALVPALVPRAALLLAPRFHPVDGFSMTRSEDERVA